MHGIRQFKNQTYYIVSSQNHLVDREVWVWKGVFVCIQTEQLHIEAAVRGAVES